MSRLYEPSIVPESREALHALVKVAIKIRDAAPGLTFDIEGIETKWRVCRSYHTAFVLRPPVGPRSSLHARAQDSPR